MQPLIDTHCHLTHQRLHGEVDQVVARAQAVGVGQMITIGCGLEDAQAALHLARRFPGVVFATAGLDPFSGHAADTDWQAHLSGLEGLLREAAPLSSERLTTILASVWLHARHVARYLSYYFSPNTHLTGEALGLFYAGTLFPEFRQSPQWRDLAKKQRPWQTSITIQTCSNVSFVLPGPRRRFR